MELSEAEKRDVRRPMNAFLIFCKRHRSMVREKNPDLDNRNVTRILGDLWANLKEEEKNVYTDLAKQYKDAFMKANPDYKWHNPEKLTPVPKVIPKPTNVKVIKNELDISPEGPIMPGKLADPSNMGGLSLLLMAGQQSFGTKQGETSKQSSSETKPDEVASTEETREPEVTSLTNSSTNAALLELAEMCSNELDQEEPVIKTVEKQVTPNYDKMRSLPVKKRHRTMSCDLTVIPTTNKTQRTLSCDQTLLQSSNTVQPSNMAPTSTLSNQPTVPVTSSVAKTSCDQMITSVNKLQKPASHDFKPVGKLPGYKGSLLAEALLEFPREEDLKIEKKMEDNVSFPKPTCSVKNEQKTKPKTENLPPKKTASDNGKSSGEEDSESTIVTCGKLVVNHIIDKLFSSDLMTAARQEKEEKLMKKVASQKDKGRSKSPRLMEGTVEAKMQQTECKTDKPVPVDTSSKVRIEQTKEVKPLILAETKPTLEQNEENFTKICSEKRCPQVAARKDGEMFPAIPAVSKIKTLRQKSKSFSEVESKKIVEMSAAEAMEVDKVEKQSVKVPGKGRKRSAMNSGVEMDSSNDAEGDEKGDDFMPVRKSRRRNRGQRYQELINEGIIQPSKERMAAIMSQKKSPRPESEEEDFQSIDAHILPETAIRRIRKRTASESDKTRLPPGEDGKRYKTGDFDLEAHIATLPACSLESMGRKRGFNKSRHNSEQGKRSEEEPGVQQGQEMETPDVIEKTLFLPPHIKPSSPEKKNVPVIGSRKRKARKHSITHLLPVPAPPSGLPQTQGLHKPATSQRESQNQPVSSIGQCDNKTDLSENSLDSSKDSSNQSEDSFEDVWTDISKKAESVMDRGETCDFAFRSPKKIEEMTTNTGNCVKDGLLIEHNSSICQTNTEKGLKMVLQENSGVLRDESNQVGGEDYKKQVKKECNVDAHGDKTERLNSDVSTLWRRGKSRNESQVTTKCQLGSKIELESAENCNTSASVNLFFNCDGSFKNSNGEQNEHECSNGGDTGEVNYSRAGNSCRTEKFRDSCDNCFVEKHVDLGPEQERKMGNPSEYVQGSAVCKKQPLDEKNSDCPIRIDVTKEKFESQIIDSDSGKDGNQPVRDPVTCSTDYQRPILSCVTSKDIPVQPITYSVLQNLESADSLNIPSIQEKTEAQEKETSSELSENCPPGEATGPEDVLVKIQNKDLNFNSDIKSQAIKVVQS